MEWVWLSLLAAFGQAFGWALKKKALNNLGLNNVVGFVSYTVAALTLTLTWVFFDTTDIVLTDAFWGAMGALIVLNIIAVWAGFKALDRSNLSALMPFMSLTAVAIVPVEYVLRGLLPNLPQIFGILVIVVGAIVVTTKKALSPNALMGAGYFALTLLCYSITSPLQGVTVTESGSGLLAAAIFHAGIALGFIPIVILTQEYRTMNAMRGQSSRPWLHILGWMACAGLASALLENGPINVALESGTASEVFALKRTMPFFALIIGILMFDERITRRQMIGTALLVVGSFLIVWYR
jgi:drug/metabolite transporter (DMT)-like permease